MYDAAMDKKTYMREYMRKRRSSVRPRMEAALRTIITHTDGKIGPTAMEIRKIALEALGEME